MPVLLSTLFCRFCKGEGCDELSHQSIGNESWYWALSGEFHFAVDPYCIVWYIYIVDPYSRSMHTADTVVFFLAYL